MNTTNIPWAGLHSFVLVASKPVRGYCLFHGARMTNRYTQTDKWNDPWFHQLNPNAKLMWMYLCDACDAAGFWEIDLDRAVLETGLSELATHTAFSELARGYIRNGRYIWLRNFLKHQRNLPLNKDNNAHKNIIRLLNEYKGLSPKISTLLKGDEISVSFDGEPVDYEGAN